MTMITKAWILIALGAIDLLGWMGTGLGWTNWIFGDNDLTKYGPAVLLAIGFWMLRIGKAQQKSLAEEACDDAKLPRGETVLHREVGISSIVTVTSQRLRFKAGREMGAVRSFAKQCPPNDAEAWSLNDIEEVKVLQTSDVVTGGMARHWNAMMSAWLPREWTLWGVGLRLRDGTSVNVPCGHPEIVARYLDQRTRRESE